MQQVELEEPTALQTLQEEPLMGSWEELETPLEVLQLQVDLRRVRKEVSPLVPEEQQIRLEKLAQILLELLPQEMPLVEHLEMQETQTLERPLLVNLETLHSELQLEILKLVSMPLLQQQELGAETLEQEELPQVAQILLSPLMLQLEMILLLDRVRMLL